MSCRRSGDSRRQKAFRTALAVCVIALSIPTARAGEREKQGKFLYEIYCSNCHGERAEGDGPTAEVLTVKPPDLTRIAARNDDEFPDAEVRRIIDGRDIPREHGRSQMPLWGLAFQELEADVVQEREVEAKIDQLVAYLKSIQKKPD